MNTVIRSYTEQDLDAMIRIWNEVVEEGNAFPQEECLTLESGRAFFAAQSYCGVAELLDEEKEEKTVIGGLYILHPNNVGRCGHISNASYAVRKDLRGYHLGEALVKDCMVQGKKLGFGILQFNAVVKTNLGARHLYEKLGFTPLGTIPDGFRMKDGSMEDIVPYYHVL